MRNLTLFFMLTVTVGVANASNIPRCFLTPAGSLAFGAQAVTLPRDASSGVEIARRTISYRMSCRNLPVGRTIAVKFRPNVDNCPAHGDSNFVSTNSIPNVGFSFAGTPVPPGGTGASAICTNSSTQVNGRFFDLVLQRVRDSSETFNFSISVALVKTSGSLQTGFASYAGNIGMMDWVLLGHYPYRNRQFENNAAISASAAVTVNALTCSIPNVRVAMGNVAASALTGPGARAAPWRNFAIPVENCPPDLNRIRFKLDNLNPMLDLPSHVMAVTGGNGSATGVGIQIGRDDGNDTIMAFSQMYDADGYNPIRSTGGRFMISLKARYFKPASVAEVGPGKADASALVIMSYR